MKIVIASGIYPPDIGGPATYSQLIAREFSKRGIEILVICYSDKKQDAENRKENFEIVRILRKNPKPIRYFIYFKKLLKIAKNVDVIYAQGPLSAGLPAMLASRILRKKFVIKIVGDYAWEQGVNQFGVKDLIEPFQKKKYNWKVELIRKIQKKVVKSADKVIVPSEFLKKIVKGWGIDEKKIEVIYNAGPDIEKIKKIAPNKELESRGDIIISAGRLEPWKGMGVLISVMPDLLKKNPRFKLVIIGKGSQKMDLKLRIESLGLKKNVELIEGLPHEELMKYFKAGNIFVLNTAYEGLPHIVLEAMACGLPVVTTNVCGNPEVIQDKYSGLLFEERVDSISYRGSNIFLKIAGEDKFSNKEQLEKAILELWKNKELQKDCIKNGYKILEKFKLEDMIDKTLKILS